MKKKKDQPLLARHSRMRWVVVSAVLVAGIGAGWWHPCGATTRRRSGS